MGQFLLYVASSLLSLLSFAIVASAILSWLVAFDVINLRNPVVAGFYRFLDAVTRPVLAPLQKVIPLLGGVDITPIIALIVIEGVRVYLLPPIFRPIIGLLG